MPDDPGALVAIWAAGGDGRVDGAVDGVELVIAGDLLRDLARLVLEDNEVTQVVEQPLRCEEAADEDLELRQVGGCDLDPIDRPPAHEPLTARRDRSDPRLDAVGGDQQLGVGEDPGNLGLVRLELVERGPDVGALGGRVLELQKDERQSIDEKDDVRPAGASSTTSDLSGKPEKWSVKELRRSRRSSLIRSRSRRRS